MATLKLRNLGKRFGRKVWAVRQLNLEVHDEEFIVLLGPSGCGKTTTLRMIAGLEESTSGTVLLDDRDITDALPRNRDVSMVFQSYAVWPHMSVYDNIAFALKLKKINKNEIEKTVREVASMVKIAELLQRYPSQLSGGQQQRVSLARALAVQPKLFLMDEPLSNLDAKLRSIMRTELKAIHQQTRATSIFVTHDQSEAMSMADRIVIMKDGEIVQIGTPDDVYFRSADIFVAGFIGTPPTNFFRASKVRDAGRLLLDCGSFRIALTAENQALLSAYEKDTLILGVRPEDIRIDTGDETLFSEKVLVVEPQGSHQIVSIKLADTMIKIVAASSVAVRPGQELQLRFSQDKLHFFDIDTEKRIERLAAKV